MAAPAISDNSAPIEGAATFVMDKGESFREEDHPRAENGEFAKVAGSSKHADLKKSDLYSVLADADDAGGKSSVEKTVKEIAAERPDLAEAAYKEAASSLGYSLKSHDVAAPTAAAKASEPKKEPTAVASAPPASSAPYHRFTQTKGPDTGVGYMMFSDEMERVESAYGSNHHTFDPELLDPAHVAYAGDPVLKRAVKSALVAYSEIAEFQEGDEDAKATAARLANGINPKDIVDTAELWDSPNIVSYLYEHVFEPRGIKAIETDDGAIVFDPKHVKSHAKDEAIASRMALADSWAADKAASARALDINGWAEIKGNPLSVVGVYGYGGNQLPNAPDPSRVYQVYRPAEELSDPECIASFRLLPWIDNHVMLGSEDDGLMPAEKKGVQGVVGEDVYFESPTLFGNLKVFSQSLANLIEAGKRELSCGYRCVYEWTSGVFEGKPYDAIQRKIRGNHLALVESGRMGPGVAVLDGSALDHFTFTIDAKDSIMAEEVNNEESGSVTSTMTLEQGLEAFKAFLPTLMLLQGMVTPAAEEAVVEEAAAEEDAPAIVIVADADKKDDDDKDDDKKKAKPFAKAEDSKAVVKAAIKEVGMDAKEVYKSVAREIAARERLYERLSVHVGAFDHSEMTEAEVAIYGAKKLALKAAPGQEHAVLSGYLQAAKDPRKVAVASGMDAAPADNAVTRYLKSKGE